MLALTRLRRRRPRIGVDSHDEEKDEEEQTSDDVSTIQARYSGDETKVASCREDAARRKRMKGDEG